MLSHGPSYYRVLFHLPLMSPGSPADSDADMAKASVDVEVQPAALDYSIEAATSGAPVERVCLLYLR